MLSLNPWHRKHLILGIIYSTFDTLFCISNTKRVIKYQEGNNSLDWIDVYLLEMSITGSLLKLKESPRM